MISGRLKKFARVAGLAGLLAACGGCNPTDPDTKKSEESENQAPNTEIISQFRDDGKVAYTFSGTDSDGSVNHVAVRVNGGASQNLSSGSSMLVDIIEGTNRVTATAYDNKDLADPTPAEYSFVSPTESQAEAIILGYLAANSSSYKKFERDVLLSLGESGSFYVDFLVTKSNNTNAVVNYVEHKENLMQESANQKLLALFGIPNLYLVRLPEVEIKSRLDIFKNKGFN